MKRGGSTKAVEARGLERARTAEKGRGKEKRTERKRKGKRGERAWTRVAGPTPPLRNGKIKVAKIHKWGIISYTIQKIYTIGQYLWSHSAI